MDRPRTVIIILLAVTFLTITSTPGHTQSQVYLRTVEPPEGQPGQELELTLRGGGFADANEVRVFIEGVEVWETWIASEQEVGVYIYIPEDAPPGPRAVELVAVFGPDEEFPAEPNVDFVVLGGERDRPRDDDTRQEPDDDDDEGGGSGLVLLLVAGVLGLAGVVVAVSVTLNLRGRATREQWQSEAQKELPEHCQSGTHFVKREKPEIKPGRWKVKGLKATLYDAASGREGAVHSAPEELVTQIDKAARHRLLRGETEKLATQVAEVARELAPLILAWQSGSASHKDVLLQARLEGGEAAVKFTRYRCVGQPGEWQKQLEWEAKLQAIDLVPGRIRGPGAGETPAAYQQALREGLAHYVYDLTREASRLL